MEETSNTDRMAMSAETVRTYWNKNVMFWEGMTKNGIRLKLPFESEEELYLFLSRSGRTLDAKQ